MNAKITKKRLADMLSYDWLKIIGAAVAGIVVWTLVFTMTATRIRPSQRFTVFNYTSNVSFSATDFYDEMERIWKSDVFSYEVIETGECDLAATADQANTLLEARLSTDEGSVMFIANAKDTSTEYKDENDETKYYTYLESFASGGFGHYMYDLSMDSEDSYFKAMESYLSKFYTDWTDEETLQADKVEKEFLLRAKKNKDKRFKTEEEKRKGIEQDIQRIEKYRNGLEDFYSYIDKGYISITQVDAEVKSGTESYFFKRYAINLCPNEDTMGELKRMVNYQTTYIGEDGKEKTKPTAKDMHLVLFNLKGVEDGFQYESLLFVNALVSSYCTELQ